jgi:hypothetical protein
MCRLRGMAIAAIYVRCTCEICALAFCAQLRALESLTVGLRMDYAWITHMRNRQLEAAEAAEAAEGVRVRPSVHGLYKSVLLLFVSEPTNVKSQQVMSLSRAALRSIAK